ncbi:hypothetical protein TBLA_0A04950 [Henningerozyma blattae CBS 6284]|uniref:Antisense of depressing factor protein 1 n=1 Tax=Henningerozyma blattae (strain ATCC 34711 / CBS 6284 / DSM 70876 / NBRC 10599 / NRRL Y-10934 / UCD 77-7) TaxID=1071380 RepID=I2GVY6_HENB6|nr:hypothetical protein TBLA_0A04950 [Tetrapisispora blattae CBS 6284]CCH58288.1 hypothetical protein TBLA_0A04950 [Tetrapisispora blattae CBS 6284]
MAKTTVRSKLKKSGKTPSRKLGKVKANKISVGDKKRAKLQVEKMNKQDSLLSDIINLNGKSKELAKNVNTLSSKQLKKDQEKDRLLNVEIKNKKKQTNDDLIAQIEMISGFSL